MNSPLNSRVISMDRISATVDSDKTWYDNIRQNHAETYQFLLNIGAMTPKHIGIRYYLTIVLYLVYVLAIGVFLYLCIEVLMGNVYDVYSSLSELSRSSKSKLSSGTEQTIVSPTLCTRFRLLTHNFICRIIFCYVGVSYPSGRKFVCGISVG